MSEVTSITEGVLTLNLNELSAKVLLMMLQSGGNFV